MELQDLNNLKLYFLIAPALYVVNAIISVVFAIKYRKDSIYAKSAGIWIGYLFLCSLQILLENSSVESRAIAWNITTFFAVSAMGLFCSDILKHKTNFKWDLGFYVVAQAMSIALYQTNLNFFWATLPATFFAAYPMLKLSPQLKNYRQNNFIKNACLVCYLLIAVHGVDYAYAATRPELLFPGYLLALMLAIGASGFTFAALIERAIIEVEIKDLLQNTARLTALGSMASEISHEIKNPVTVLTLNNANMKEKLEREDRVDVAYFKEKIAVAEKMLTRLISIMNTLRSHYNSGVYDEFKSVRIQEIFDEVSSLCSLRAQKTGTKVEFYVHDEAAVIECRSVQIIQTLQNIVQNAMDAQENQSNAWVKVISQTWGPGLIRISVTDNGPGIPQKIRSNIFASFFTTKPKDKGTGLGLSLSKRYVEDHGGQIYLDDVKKTTFVLILPISQSQKTPKKVFASPAS